MQFPFSYDSQRRSKSYISGPNQRKTGLGGSIHTLALSATPLAHVLTSKAVLAWVSMLFNRVRTAWVLHLPCQRQIM